MNEQQARNDKVLEKVRKLLALAGSSNEHEAALAAERAHAILAENNLTLADVGSGSASEGFVIEKDVVTDSYPWRRQLANAVATLYFCKYYYETVKKGKTRYDVHCFAGQKHNIAVARLMFDYLHKTVDRLAREGARKVANKKKRSPYRVSFRSACTKRLLARIAERIEAARAGKIKSETGTTLPALASMYDQVKAKLDDFIEEEVGPMKTKKHKLAVLDAQGMVDGHAAGDKIGLEAQVETNAGARIEKRAIVTALELEKCEAGFRALLYALDDEHKPINILNIREHANAEVAMHAACEGFSPPTYAKKGTKLDHGDALSVYEVAQLMLDNPDYP